MGEAFVKVFEPEYRHVNEFKRAARVFQKLSARFADYKEVAPHKGLKMNHPADCVSLSQTPELSSFRGGATAQSNYFRVVALLDPRPGTCLVDSR